MWNNIVFHSGVRQTNEQLLPLNPQYSLKKLEVKIQANISKIKQQYCPLIQQSLKEWELWIHSQTPNHRSEKALRGWFGSELGVFNSIDQEILLKKASTGSSYIGQIQTPLRSTLLSLAHTQSLAANLWTTLANNTQQDSQAVVGFMGKVQSNISLAFQCKQAQLCVATVCNFRKTWKKESWGNCHKN